MTKSPEDILQPLDEYNRTLLDLVHPQDWQNPVPRDRYHLAVLGAGTAGLVTAAGAAGLGARVALVERHLLGGDCLNVGCVPSKTLIRTARALEQVRRAGEFGIEVAGPVTVDFARSMERLRRIRSEIAPHDSAKRFQSLGVDVFLGEGTFTGMDRLAVGGQEIRFQKAVIATGARAAVPLVPGLKEAGCLTNETVFNLTELPGRLAVIGAGPIGCELSQAFQRLGSKVALFERAVKILPREDRDAASIVESALRRDGIDLKLGAELLKVEKTDRAKLIHFREGDLETTMEFDEILVGAGRQPNLESLNLKKAGVEFDARTGVAVNDFLQTSNPRVFAAGDICSSFKFTHSADAMARIVIQNALFLGRKRVSLLTIPWCTYTDPEVAHVGLSEKTAEEAGIGIDTFTRRFAEVDRARTDGETEGFAKIHVRRGSDKIVGATIVASHAGDLISEVTLAMKSETGLGSLASVIHPYPTQGEAIRQLGDLYNRTRLTPMVRRLFELWFRWTL